MVEFTKKFIEYKDFLSETDGIWDFKDPIYHNIVASAFKQIEKAEATTNVVKRFKYILKASNHLNKLSGSKDPEVRKFLDVIIDDLGLRKIDAKEIGDDLFEIDNVSFIEAGVGIKGTIFVTEIEDEDGEKITISLLGDVLC